MSAKTWSGLPFPTGRDTIDWTLISSIGRWILYQRSIREALCGVTFLLYFICWEDIEFFKIHTHLIPCCSANTALFKNWRSMSKFISINFSTPCAQFVSLWYTFNFYNISNFFIMIILIMMICDQWSLMIFLQKDYDSLMAQMRASFSNKVLIFLIKVSTLLKV